MSAWGLRDHILIERALPEFANPDITHNVEYSLHPKKGTGSLKLKSVTLPLTTRKIRKSIEDLKSKEPKAASALLSKCSLMRNCCVFDETSSSIKVAHLEEYDSNFCDLALVELLPKAFAIVECKRVGVEEGMKKGPQTIEKAKQGAYVARSVSALQKVRLRDGKIVGVIPGSDGELICRPHKQFLEDIVNGNDPNLLRDFILTIGMVSNHGNWFTSDNPNKELRVLAHSYDWLVFLTDRAIAQFVQDLLLTPTKSMTAVRTAFVASYAKDASGKKSKNRFTKVGMDLKAHLALLQYFRGQGDSLDSWYNVIAPKHGSLTILRQELSLLAKKDWSNIVSL